MNLRQYLSREELEKLRFWLPYIPRWRRRLMRLYAQAVLIIMRVGHACWDMIFVEYPAWILTADPPLVNHSLHLIIDRIVVHENGIDIVFK